MNVCLVGETITVYRMGYFQIINEKKISYIRIIRPGMWCNQLILPVPAKLLWNALYLRNKTDFIIIYSDAE